MPLSKDPEKRARQLANLRTAPPAPRGNARALRHGLTTKRPGSHALGPAVALVVAELEEIVPGPLRDAESGDVAGWARESVQTLAVLKLAMVRAERWVSAEEDKHGHGSVPVDVLDQQARLATRYRQALSEEALTLRGRLGAGIDAMRGIDLASALSEPDPALRTQLLRRAGLIDDEEGSDGG